MRMQLRDLAPGQTYAVQWRTNTGEMLSEWSQIQYFTTTNDLVAPSPVTGLSFFDSGTSMIAEWTAPTTDAAGKPLNDFRHYRITVTDGTANADFIVSGPKFELSRSENIRIFGTLKSSVTVFVRAVDNNYNESTALSVAASPANPPVPSTPVIGTYLGLMYLTWNGKTATATDMPVNFSYCEVHVSTTTNFTPSDTTYVTRITGVGSGAKAIIPGLTYGTTYYFKLVAVNDMMRKSAGSAQASGTPVRISGLDITNGQIGTDQINFTARDIGGANAYYPATTTAMNALTGVKSGDIAYITGSGYTTYKHNGTAWVLAPEIGKISGTKILTGTLTADAVGTNLIIASSANIGTAAIDAANISTVNAGSIRTGSLAADVKILAGPATGNHAEVTSGGIYVLGPAGNPDANGIVPIVPRVKMGTDTNDYFSIPNPNDISSTLAQIADDGTASFQGLSVETDIVIQGKKLLQDHLGPTMVKVVGAGNIAVAGLEQAGNVGIRSEYGLGQIAFPVEAGRAYMFFIRTPYWYTTGGGGVSQKLRIRNGGTPDLTSNSGVIMDLSYGTEPPGEWQNKEVVTFWPASFTGTAYLATTLQYFPPAGDTTTVIKVINGSLGMWAIDMGQTPAMTGNQSSLGGQLYGGAATTPTTPVQQYFYQSSANEIWVGKGDKVEMTNHADNAYQGWDPSGANGDMTTLIYWSGTDWPAVLAGARIDKMELFLYANHWYYASGGDAVIGTHGTRYRASWANNPRISPALKVETAWPRGAGRWCDISLWGDGFKSGYDRGIVLGPSGGTNLRYYGRFDGQAGQKPIIRVWYTK